MSSRKGKGNKSGPKFSARARVKPAATPYLLWTHQDRWAALVNHFVTSLKRHVPGWTDKPLHDPGVALMELLAFVADDLAARQDEIAKEAYLAVGEHSRRERHPFVSECTPLRRIRYFSGKVLSVEDLHAEQEYVRARFRNHNLWFHGSGVARGLKVEIAPSSHNGPASIFVEPGLAIDPQGDEIIVCERLSAVVPFGVGSCYVNLLRVDVPIALVPAVTGHASEAARVEERAKIEVSRDIAQAAVPLARLKRDRTVWRLDPEFKVCRAR